MTCTNIQPQITNTYKLCITAVNLCIRSSTTYVSLNKFIWNELHLLMISIKMKIWQMEKHVQFHPVVVVFFIIIFFFIELPIQILTCIKVYFIGAFFNSLQKAKFLLTLPHNNACICKFFFVKIYDLVSILYGLITFHSIWISATWLHHLVQYNILYYTPNEVLKCQVLVTVPKTYAVCTSTIPFWKKKIYNQTKYGVAIYAHVKSFI